MENKIQELTDKIYREGVEKVMKIPSYCECSGRS